MQGAIAILAALLGRAQSSRGAFIEAPLVSSAALGLLLGVVGRSPNTSADKIVEADFEIPDILKECQFVAGDDQRTQLEKLSKPSSKLLGPFMRAYKCGDGRYLMVWPQSTAALDQFLTLIGVANEIRRMGFVNEGPWLDGVSNNLGTLGDDEVFAVSEIVERALREKSAADWEVLLARRNVAVAVVRTQKEWMNLPAMLEAGVFVQTNGRIEPGLFHDLSSAGQIHSPTNFQSPTNLDFEEVLTLLDARGKDEGSHSFVGEQKKENLLKGLKVLDLSNLVAGPTATYTLAQYGADVIKADPPRFVHPNLISTSMLEVNQGKRSILTDVTTAPGREVFERLVRWADVVVHNCVDEVAERLGVSINQLQAVNPDVVSCQFSYLGGVWRTSDGWEKFSGFDSLAQASSGIMIRYGTNEYPQFHGHITCGDIMGGIGGAFAALLAVYYKRKTGQSTEARTSLARMINYIQLPDMIMKGGQIDAGDFDGQFTLGKTPWARLYKCLDDWIYVETSSDRAAELALLLIGQHEIDVPKLEHAFRQQNVAYWFEKLSKKDIGTHLVSNIDSMTFGHEFEVDADPVDRFAGDTIEVVLREKHPSGRPVFNLAPSWVRIGEMRNYRILSPALRYGDSTRVILSELGYSCEEINTLIKLRVAHEFLPELRSKDRYFADSEI